MSWREVDAPALGSAPRQYVRTRGGVVWRLDARLAGLVSTAASHDEICASMSALLRLPQCSEAPLDLVFDLSRCVVTPGNAAVMEAVFAHMPQISRLFAPLVRRQAGVAARNFARPYWKALNLAVGTPWETEVFDANTPALAWLGAAPDVAAEIGLLVDDLMQPKDPVRGLRAALRLDPAANLPGAARALGMSARSLQRALTAAGETFAALRTRVRLERAKELLLDRDGKIEGVARGVGFASTTHFAAWFRRLHGATPSQFRERS